MFATTTFPFLHREAVKIVSSPKPRFEFAFLGLQSSHHHCDTASTWLLFAKLLRQSREGFLRLGQNHQSAGAALHAMHETGSRILPAKGKII